MTGKSYKPDDKRRKARGAWKPGQSGNPSGKPKGCGRLSWFNTLIKDQREEILLSIVERAKNGNATAMELVASRMVPVFMPQDETVEIEGFVEAKTRSEKANLITTSVAKGEITPNQGAAVMASLEKESKINETDDLAKRIEELERKLK